MKKRIKKYEKVFRTSISRNKGIHGDSIEIMLVKIREGEGTEAISDRDLVYNDNESDTVNPVTNIRSDKFELMLDEKIGEYEHRNKKKAPKVEEKKKDDGEGDPSGD
ncbi:MAG: hypothetical protein [Wigfec virus K19_81]|nr:MAG: hypothetical protein [Wigfec virus K19_81]